MAFYGKVHEEVKAKLRKYWKESKKNRDVFRESVKTDKSLTQGWLAYDNLVRRMGLYKGVKPSPKKYPFSQLKEAERIELKELLVISGIIAAQQKFPQFKVEQLRKYAKNHYISIKRLESDKSYDERLRGLIETGNLNKDGIPGLFSIIGREFPNVARGLTRKSFRRRVDELVWTKSKLDELRDAIKHGLSAETFYEYNPHIPLKLIQIKARWLKGVVSADQFLAHTTLVKGIGRLSVEGTTKKDEMFKFPDSSLNKPYPISVSDTWKFYVINGANFGTLYNPLIDQNPLRLALAYADKTGADAVFITNLLNVEFRKAVGSELHILKAFVSGHNVNPNILSADYRKEAERILTESPDDEVVYETAAELVVNIIWGLRKVSHKPIKNGDTSIPKDWVPEYNGKVYIIFGHNEESLIANVAYWELNFITNMRKNIFETERKLIKLAIKRTELSLSVDDETASRDNNVKLLQQLKDKDNQFEDMAIRRRVTLASGQDRRRFTNRLRAIVVRKIEEAIPNSKVIGQGMVNLKIGEKVVQLHIPSHTRVTEGLLDAYVKTYGALSRRQLVPDSVIICHPYSLNYRMAVREINSQNARAEAKIYTAPILVDGEFLRSELENSVRSVHPISKVVFHTNFCPGIIQASYINGIFNAERIGLDVLMQADKIKKNDRKKLTGAYIWIMVMTDPHFGAPDRVEMWSKATGGSLGVGDAVIQMLRDSGLCQSNKLPIHMTTTNDDGVNAHHFENHKQPDPRQISYQDKERIAREMIKADKSAEEMAQFLLEQDRLKGTHWLQNQIEQVKQRHIKLNLDFFEGVVQRNMKSDLEITPISKIHNVIQDMRDLGAVNLGTGNHMESEIDRSLTEGFIYRDYLRALLYGRCQGKISEETINKLVVSPLEGNQYFAWGYVGMPGEYQWAIEFRSDPPRLSSWADVLKATVINDALRGDYGLYMTGHKTIKIYGDKHFFAAVDIDDVFYHMCASGTHTNLYGHRGFPPNNTGISFVGLPVGGPSAGPILVRPIHVQHILRYFEKPFKFDWDAFLPNPV